MNIIQLSEHVFKCESEFSPTNTSIKIPNNTWLIKHHDDVYIIDTAVRDMVYEQIKAAKAIGNPKAILLTHGHYDHINGAEVWLEEFDIPIYAHHKELVYIKGEKPYPFRGFLQTEVASVVQPLTDELFTHLSLQYYLTPGHTTGHVVYHHELEDLLLAGDLFVTSRDDLHPPLRRVSIDINENIDSGYVIDKIKPNIISTTHGQEHLYNDKSYEKYVFWYRD